MFFSFVNFVFKFLITAKCKKFVFFSESDSNRLTCGKSGKKQMKCTVYKNGVKWIDNDSKSKQTLEKQLDGLLVNEIWT